MSDDIAPEKKSFYNRHYLKLWGFAIVSMVCFAGYIFISIYESPTYYTLKITAEYPDRVSVTIDGSWDITLPYDKEIREDKEYRLRFSEDIYENGTIRYEKSENIYVTSESLIANIENHPDYPNTEYLGFAVIQLVQQKVFIYLEGD